MVDGEADGSATPSPAAAIYFGFLFVAHLISPRGMGFGDVKLAAVMGLYVGWLGTTFVDALALVLWAMLIGFAVGSVFGFVRARHAAGATGPSRSGPSWPSARSSRSCSAAASSPG